MTGPTESLGILTGIKEIAIFLEITPRQVELYQAIPDFPTFKAGKTVCARKSKLLAWVEEQEKKGVEQRSRDSRTRAARR